MAFEPVPLVSRDGRPFIARSPVQLTNLLNRGYARTEQEIPETPLFVSTVHLVPPDSTADESTEDQPSTTDD